MSNSVANGGLVSAARRIYKRIAPDAVTHDGVVIPAKHLRLGGAEFRSDDFFIESGRKEAQRLRNQCGVKAGSSVLDMGCGVGRLAIGLLGEFGDAIHYTGIDVDPLSLSWCKRHIQANHPAYVFVTSDAQNRRYNAEGAALDGKFRMPFADHSFDAIYLYSVFSHMCTDEVSIYLREFSRVLKAPGAIFLTAFVEDGVPDCVENPEDYRMDWKGALHCVRFSRPFFLQLLASSGFEVSEFVYGRETDGQSAFYLRHAAGKAASASK